MKVLSIKVKKEFLNKEACLNEARKIITEGIISGMSELQLAREIYFHALAYFLSDRIFFLRWIQNFADPIDMRDGGDTLLRRAVFASSWILTKRKK